MKRVQAAVEAFIERKRAYRVPLLLFAAAAFFSGLVWSFVHLEIALADLHLAPLIVLAVVLAPATLAYSAINMSLMAHAAGTRISLASGMRISVYAQIAELLPIPGGAIVRTAALVKAGGTGAQSTGLVLGFALLWIACAACAAAIALNETGTLAIALAVGGCAGVFALCYWLARAFGWRIALAALGLRLIGLGLLAARLAIAFTVIGAMIPLSAALTFAFATIVGSAASLVPAGLGVSEGLAALLASSIDVAPAAAFLATAVSRLVGLAVTVLIAPMFFRRAAADPRALDDAGATIALTSAAQTDLLRR